MKQIETTSSLRRLFNAALESGLNMLLRCLTLASKFFLMVYLAKVLPTEQLGIYALFTVTVSYALYICGLDFYTYTQREMLSAPLEKWGEIIRNQFIFYGVVYLFVLPIMLLIFIFDVLPWKIIGWFYLLLTLEHLSQELSRLLVTCGRVTLTSITLFFRCGAWVFVVVSIYKYNPDLKELWPIWAGWSLGVSVSIVVAMVPLSRIIGQCPKKITTDWQWIFKGLKKASQLLIGTLALRGLFTFDRYFLDLYAGKTQVAIYSFYMSIANAMMTFADAGIVTKIYPKIIVAYKSGKYDEFQRLLKALTIGIISLYAAFLVVMILIINQVLSYVGKDTYSDQIIILWILFLAMAIFSLSLVPHYSLYAHGNNRSIAIASILAFAAFIVSSALFKPNFGTIEASISILIATTTLGLTKFMIMRKKTRKSRLI